MNLHKDIEHGQFERILLALGQPVPWPRRCGRTIRKARELLLLRWKNRFVRGSPILPGLEILVHLGKRLVKLGEIIVVRLFLVVRENLPPFGVAVLDGLMRQFCQFTRGGAESSQVRFALRRLEVAGQQLANRRPNLLFMFLQKTIDVGLHDPSGFFELVVVEIVSDPDIDNRLVNDALDRVLRYGSSQIDRSKILFFRAGRSR
ncbi:MAG: hypothetical protein IIC02_03195 [Planctomycetes bacterium]|nr:hypothetical protein [Planctomycetota bacterium]